MMAILEWGRYPYEYLCQACKNYDTDGIDGNSPFCRNQPYEHGKHRRVIPLGEECPFGFEPGVPTSYPAGQAWNKERAEKILAMLEHHNKMKVGGDA